MPQTDNDDNSFINGIINIAGASLYPLSLSLLLPVFMYSIVLEKEDKLIVMMKMNGMKIINYWIVNYFFFFSMYSITATTFMLFGYFVLKLSFFTETSGFLLLSVLIGWGLF